MSDLTPSGYGAVLRRRREELALSLEDLAASTRIRKTYLQALEEENLRALPGSAYAVGFLRIYARHLSLPVEPLLAALHGDEESAADTGVLPLGGQKRRNAARTRRGKGGSWRLALLLLLLAGVAAAYLALRTKVPPERPLPPKAPAAMPAPAPVPPPISQPVPQPPPAVTPPPAAPSPAGSAEVKPVELAVIPPNGAVVRILPVSAGTMKVSLDRQEFREYQLQPDQSLYWKVSESLTVELSAPGLARIWVEQQELPVAEYPSLTLYRMRPQEARP